MKHFLLSIALALPPVQGRAVVGGLVLMNPATIAAGIRGQARRAAEAHECWTMPTADGAAYCLALARGDIVFCDAIFNPTLRTWCKQEFA